MRYIFPILTMTLIIHSCSAPGKPEPIKYPETKQGTQTDDFFGTKVSDPYRWLENDTATDTKEWVSTQNKVSEEYFSKIPFREAIKKRVSETYNFEKYSIPYREGGYTYYRKNSGLQNQSVIYREKEEGKPEIFLDPNKFSGDGTTSIPLMSYSRDGSKLGYTISEGGSDWNKLVVMDAINREMLDDTVDVKFTNISWWENDGFFYSSYDKPKEGSRLSGKTEFHKLFYHKLGTKQSTDQMIFGGENTPRRYINGTVTEDGAFLVITAANSTFGNELYIKDLKRADSQIQPVVTGFDNEQSIVYSDKDRFYILTNLKAPNRKLVVADLKNPVSSGWKDLIPESKFPLDVTTAAGKLYATYIKDATSQIIQYDVNGKMEKEISLPGLGTAAGFTSKKEETSFYYVFTSFLYPPTIFKYDVASGQSVIFKKANVQFNPDEYESKQVFYSSKDGTKIPMIITHKKGITLNGANPTLLYGYGGFNVSLTPYFSMSNALFLEQGGIFVEANLRGGGEYGDAWHEAGIKMKKQNVFDDFISAAEWLIKEKYTSNQYLAIMGGSNGGLLVGACMTQRPDLFRVCLPAVGVMDMLRYHQFTAGAGWAYDYGTAADSKEMFDYLLKYSPVQSIKPATCYPATLITTADHDDRVVPAHSFKFAATMQRAQNCDKPILIKIETRSGHGAGMSTEKMIEDVTDRLSFIFYNMGLSYK